MPIALLRYVAQIRRPTRRRRVQAIARGLFGGSRAADGSSSAPAADLDGVAERLGGSHLGRPHAGIEVASTSMSAIRFAMITAAENSRNSPCSSG